MGDETAIRFREPARKCREIAAEVKTEEWRESLLTLPQDLENEADEIDAEDRPDLS